jgi:hypothetical protein
MAAADVIKSETLTPEDSKALQFAFRKTAGLISGIAGGFGNSGATAGQSRAASALDTGRKVTGIASTAIVTGFMVKKIIDKLKNDHRRRTMLEDLTLNDPFIKQADPERVKEFYATIYHLAPDLSGDKNTVRELLRNFIKFDRVDLQSVKTLIDSQKSLSSNKSQEYADLMRLL